MPTKTKDNSPLEFDPTVVGKMMTRGAQQIMTSAAAKPMAQLATQVAPNIAKKGLGTLLGGAIKANPVGAILTGAKGLIGGIGEVVSDRREALAAGEKYGFGEGLKDAATGFLKGATGVDLTDKDVYEQPEYTTNIDPMTGQEIPLTMKKPIKELTQTGSDSPVPYNMSAAQYKSAALMNKISGAGTLMKRSDLMFTKDGLEKLDAANIGGKFGKIVKDELKEQS